MTTADALLAAVIASPDDDLPRLVYADWLEENGQPDRAEFIRLQIEREQELLPTGIHTREKVLLEAHTERWLAPLRQPGGPLGTQRSHAAFRRGFVETVWLPAAWFMRTAEQLFALAPVTELRVMLDRLHDAGELVHSKHFARLRVLDVCDPRFGLAVALQLPSAGHLFRELKVLRMQGCNLGDGTVSLFCRSQLSPELLDLRHNPLSESARTDLRNRFGNAVRFE